MQKTYDECYLVCSTAVYFEGQNNEAEALRSWRSALDQIYYHNAYRVPPNYKPKSETEKALQDSLRDMEMQCKERVELLEALRKSRDEAKDSSRKSSNGGLLRGRPPVSNRTDSSMGQTSLDATIQDVTVPAVTYPDLSPQPPPLPQRPAILQTNGSGFSAQRSHSASQILTSQTPLPYPPPPLPVPQKHASRTPSPEKKSRMLTTLRTKDGKRPSKSPRASSGRGFNPPPASSKAAGLAWDSTSKSAGQRLGQLSAGRNESTTTVDSLHQRSVEENHAARPSDPATSTDREDSKSSIDDPSRPRSPFGLITGDSSKLSGHRRAPIDAGQHHSSNPLPHDPHAEADLISSEPPTSPPHDHRLSGSSLASTLPRPQPKTRPPVDYMSYRNEYPPTSTPTSKLMAQLNASANHRPSEGFRTASLPIRQQSPQRKTRPLVPNGISRRPVAGLLSPRRERRGGDGFGLAKFSDSGDENTSSSHEAASEPKRVPRKPRKKAPPVDTSSTSSDKVDKEQSPLSSSPATGAWEDRVRHVKKHLPKGVDENAAKQIFNEIVIQGDEVHWADVAGLEIAKKALKEAVVYPFLRPDLFMGLREPARGMLLFGPPGTGKTMLARAVATESRSTFFAISASSLTSKWLGESEKLVRALFSLAKALAPSIIFVDEIDSLLSSRGGSSEHESTRRIKTEFLIQWSDLQKAAAGKAQTDKEKTEGDASRVLVLAATNMPWAIDEAARRRFVRRQYIPLPEPHVRAEQLRTLLGHQKHNLNESDIEVLVQLTDGNFLLRG